MTTRRRVGFDSLVARASERSPKFQRHVGEKEYRKLESLLVRQHYYCGAVGWLSPPRGERARNIAWEASVANKLQTLTPSPASSYVAKGSMLLVHQLRGQCT